MEYRQWLLGSMMTVAVAIIWWSGGLDRFEFMAQDEQQGLFYARTGQPAEEVALVAIDDRSLDTVGRWPWDREKLAAIVYELKRAKANVVALDILLNEPQPRRYVEEPNPLEWEFRETPPTEEELERRLVPVDDDKILARAIADHSRVVLAAKFPAQEIRQSDEVSARVRLDPVFQVLERDSEVQEALRRMQEIPATWAGSAVPSQAAAYREAEKVALNTLRRAIWGEEETVRTLGHEQDEMRRVLDRVLAIKSASDLSSLPQGVAARPWARSSDPNPPTSVLATPAARLANVSFDTIDVDSRTRRVPLWVEHRARLWPSLGLAAVMEYRGVYPEDVEIGSNDFVIRVGETETRFPLMKSRFRRGNEVDGLTYVTWPRGVYGMAGQVAAAVESARQRFAGNEEQLELVFNRRASEMSGWEWQLFRLDEARTQIVQAGRLYEPTLQAERLRTNFMNLARVVEKACARFLTQLITPEERDEFRLAIRRLLRLAPDESGELILFETDNVNWLRELETVRRIARKAHAQAVEFLDTSAGVKTRADIDTIPDLQPEDRAVLETAATALDIPIVLNEIDDSILAVAEIRRQLAYLLGGKIVVVGFTALATDSDVVSTPIDSKTPGAMVHVAVANALLRNMVRARWDPWVDFVSIGIMGIMGTWLGVRLNVFAGPLALVALGVTWFLISGALLWDARLTIAAIAGPGVAAGGGWVTVLLHRLLVEQRGRKVTEERFKSYVSPAVVDILVNNPELGTMRPSMRDMTVMFTDVADFTTTSERLGPELLAKCLSKYLKEMTEILQQNRGTLDKYLGDGIMAFYNAPLDDPEHARHACATAVSMLARLDELNDAGAFEEAGRLRVRVGICTGPCMVGDFGNPPRNSNYTLLGDTANFAARLEGANKFFGTRILAVQRTRDFAGPDVRWRTIGKVFVKGKKEADLLSELVGRLEPHGPATEEWLQLTEDAVADYAAGRFDPCLEKFDMLARRFGDVKLAEIYAEAVQTWKSRPDFETAFDGAIVLTEK